MPTNHWRDSEELRFSLCFWTIVRQVSVVSSLYCTLFPQLSHFQNNIYFIFFSIFLFNQNSVKLDLGFFLLSMIFWFLDGKNAKTKMFEKGWISTCWLTHMKNATYPFSQKFFLWDWESSWKPYVLGKRVDLLFT